MKEIKAPKYLTLWKDGRWVFLKREEFERQGFVEKLVKVLKKLFKR